MRRAWKVLDAALVDDEVSELVTLGCLVVFMLALAVLAGVFQ